MVQRANETRTGPTKIKSSKQITMVDADRRNVNVVLRLRPFVAHEKEKGCTKVVHKVRSKSSDEVVQVNQKTNRYFEFDAVLDESDSQKDVYLKSGAHKAVTTDIFRGFNSTIFAYGQSGSGKTFTMGTTKSAGGSEIRENSGVIPRACADLFAHIGEKCQGNASVELSYLEVYNEEIRDLLTSDVDRKIQIREDFNGEVFVEGLTTIEVTSPLEVGKLMNEANGRRAVASTKINEVSSRSHAICIISIQGTTIEDVTFRSRLTLVDLAGSERLAKTENTGWRRKEGININQGLFVLGLVISALTEKRPHMKRNPPYRESKLTRLLQDSLGGNSRTIMIACCSPADFHADETVNTLRYATQARSIENPATANIIHDESSEQVLALKEENEELRRENELLKQQLLDYQVTIKQITSELTDVGSEFKEVIQDITANNTDVEKEDRMNEIEMERQCPARILSDSATETTTYSELTSDACSESKDAISQQIPAQNIVEENEEAQNIVEENEEGTIGIEMEKQPVDRMLTDSSSTPLQPLQAMEVYHDSSVVEEKEGPCTACGYDRWKTRGPLFDPKRLSCRERSSDEEDEVMVEAIPVPVPTPVDPSVHAESNLLSRDAEGITKSMMEEIADSLGNVAHRRKEEEEETFTESSKEKSRKRGRKSSSFFDKVKLPSAFNCGSGSYGLQDLSKFKYYS
jgi:hypothetical protein